MQYRSAVRLLSVKEINAAILDDIYDQTLSIGVHDSASDNQGLSINTGFEKHLFCFMFTPLCPPSLQTYETVGSPAYHESTTLVRACLFVAQPCSYHPGTSV
jgi:hypothetical protein